MHLHMSYYKIKLESQNLSIYLSKYALVYEGFRRGGTQLRTRFGSNYKVLEYSSINQTTVAGDSTLVPWFKFNYY